MSKLKVSPNLFLEIAEINQWTRFLEKDGWKRAVKALVSQPGIVRNSDNSSFRVSLKSGNVVRVAPGLAYDGEMNAIVSEEEVEVNVPNTGVTRWIILGRAVTNWERGTVSIATDGTLSGVGTEFTSVLRGQPNYPVRVRFSSAVNTGDYEVISVTSNGSALLAGDFVAEGGVRYAVMGTFTPGFLPEEEDKLIYEYDYFSLRVVDSAARPGVADGEFILAQINYTATGSMSIVDERLKVMFDTPYIQDDTEEGGSGGGTLAYENPLTSLLSTSVISAGATSPSIGLELIIEHCYNVTQFEINYASGNEPFNIISGSCNFLGTGDVPDGMFMGWRLLNRGNMRWCTIDDNVNKTLVISTFDSSIVEETMADNDFIIVPPFEEIQYRVRVDNNVDRPAVPFYCGNDIANGNTRIGIYVYCPNDANPNFVTQVPIHIEYRLKSYGERYYPWQPLAIAKFVNVNGEVETLADSTFTVDIENMKPVEALRNYS